MKFAAFLVLEISAATRAINEKCDDLNDEALCSHDCEVQFTNCLVDCLAGDPACLGEV